ncbi:Cupredoxin [Exidia glandulosa HHB12029]|uniref:Cupredoxin n=1 Tax=Exidia glandulosa HHB12029 TaxID=1314781 RepID=A0A165ZK74_EXIGL|nr:Cupredoxin [Exidia glandulosa HHB12029]
MEATLAPSKLTYVTECSKEKPTSHSLKVIAVPVGERFQILVPLDQKADDYTIRVALNVLPQYMSGYAVLSYKTGIRHFSSPPPQNKAFIDYGGNSLPGAVLLDPTTLRPFPAVAPPSGPADVTIRISIERTEARAWTLNGIPLPTLPNDFTPLLLDPSGVSQLDPALHTSFRNGSIVDIILEAGPIARWTLPPLTLHNVKAFFLGTGTGPFPAATVWEAFQNNATGLNLINPPLRDGFNTAATAEGSSWAAIRFLSTNPSVTFIHCHLDPHLAGGMSYILMEGLEALPEIPAEYKDFC